MTLEQIKSKLKEIGGKNDNFALVAPDINALTTILGNDEEVLHAASGLYSDKNGMVVATSKRVIFLYKSFMGSLKLEDFAYDKITSVQYESGFFGSIKVLASGNSAEIKRTNAKQAQAFGEWLRAKISEKPAVQNTTPQPDKMDQLEKLAALKEKGILTDEEFQTEKKKILAL